MLFSVSGGRVCRLAAGVFSSSASGMHSSSAIAKHVEGFRVRHDHRLLAGSACGELAERLQLARSAMSPPCARKLAALAAMRSCPSSELAVTDSRIAASWKSLRRSMKVPMQRQSDRAAEVARHVVEARGVAGFLARTRRPSMPGSAASSRASGRRRAGAATTKKSWPTLCAVRSMSSMQLDGEAAAAQRSPARAKSTLPSRRGRNGIIRKAGSAGQQHDRARTARRCSRR